MKQETLKRPPRLFETTQDKEEFVFWIETLKAGVLPQGQGKLQSFEGYCCLGVGLACTVAENNMKISIGTPEQLDGMVPACQPRAPKWLKNIAYHSDEYYLYGPIAANDGGAPHPKIAEKLWQLYKWELED